MTPYRVKRRAFLAGLGGATGLGLLLRNLEASANGATSPARLLVMHFPFGTESYHFLPQPGESFLSSRILAPFAPLADDTIVLHGLTHEGIENLGGGDREAGTVMTMTGANVPGSRKAGAGVDNPVAGGPSFDQILLGRAPGLGVTGAQLGPGYANVLCDARVVSLETMSTNLCYAYDTLEVTANRPVDGAMLTEHIGLLPELSPSKLYATLFAGLVPGGSSTDAMVRALQMRKSVLDSALTQLADLRALVPSSEREKLDIHAEVIRQVERQLSDQLATPTAPGSCTVPPSPDPALVGRTGARANYDAPTPSDDVRLLSQIGKAHAALLRAAFQCDLLRVATFQWLPATTPLAVAVDPTDPENLVSLQTISRDLSDPSGPPPTDPEELALFEGLVNFHTFINQQTAAILAEFKQALDVFGRPLLDSTVVPFVTEVADMQHPLSPIPALVIGGRALGMQGGQLQSFSTPRPHNDLWLTLAQAFFPDGPSVVDALNGEVFLENTDAWTGPIEGLWVAP